MNVTFLLLTFLGALGCSNSYDIDTDTGMDVPELYGDLRIDVHPSTMNLDASTAALPATFWEVLGDADADAPREIDVLLPEPVTLSGTITGWEITPWRSADLPGIDAPLQAEVHVRKTGTVQSQSTLCNEEGFFTFQLVPGEDYEVSVLSGHPLIPFHTQTVSITEDLNFDLPLGYGTAVWGWVFDDTGQAIAEAEVFAENSFAVKGSSSLTDSNGFYMLRVLPGNYHIVTSGRSHGRDPVMLSEEVVVRDDVGAEGVKLELHYPNLNLVTISGRAVDSFKQGLQNITVRLTAQSLDDYDEQASFQVELTTNGPGNFDTRVVPGEYILELLPATDTNLSPLATASLRVSDDVDLGDLTLAAMLPYNGWVVDEQGNSVPSTIVVAQEIGYGNRSWQAISNETGSFVLALPQVPMKISLTPTITGAQLALTTLRFDPTSDEALELTVRKGQSVYGTIQAKTASSTTNIQQGLIEFHNANDVLLGASLTGSDGSYSLSILSDLEL